VRIVIVLLRGGPDDLPKVWEVPSGGIEDPVKIPLGNGFEHFDFAREYADFEGRPTPVYTWVYRTAIAE
jgi:Family of unknown function (DUF5988)